MRLRVTVTVGALLLPSLLTACATGHPGSPSGSPVESPAALTEPGRVVTYLQGFYRSYVAARNVGQRASDAVIRSHVAAWYYPILETPDLPGIDPVACNLGGPVAGWSFEQAAVLGGQAVTVIGSQPPGAPQKLWIVATTVPETGKITGITCSIGGQDVSKVGAKDGVTSWYSAYVTTLREGDSPADALAQLTQSGPAAADPYLQQLRRALARQELGYDPVTCAADGVPDVSVGTTTVMAGGSVGLVVVSTLRAKFLATVVLGAKGWNVADIACLR